MIARHVPEKAERLNCFFSIKDPERLRSLLKAAGFHDIRIESQNRTIEFASFDAYFSGIEKGATLSGQEYVQLAPDLHHVVREAVRRQLKSAPGNGPLAVEMEVHIGSGRR